MAPAHPHATSVAVYPALFCSTLAIFREEGDFSSVKLVDFGNAIHCVYAEVSLYYDDFELQTLLYRAPEVIGDV